MSDRKKIVKPIVFVISSSLLFIVFHKLFGFTTGSSPQNLESSGVNKVFDWFTENYGIWNILLGFFIGFWIRLFFIKSSFNLYEIFTLLFFIIGIGNLIFTFFGIVESITGLETYGFTFLIALTYSSWAIGSFFTKNKVSGYFKGFLAYLFGVTTLSFIMVLTGILMDFFEMAS